MQQILLNKQYNDSACVNNYEIPNILLMENAANGLARFIAKKCQKNSKLNYDKYHDKYHLSNVYYTDSKKFDLILHYSKAFEIIRLLNTKPLNQKVIFLCGNGDNGADGLAAARILNAYNPYIDIVVILLKQPKSPLCITQYNILKNIESNLIYNQDTSLSIIQLYDFFDWHNEKGETLYKGNDNFIQSIQEIFNQTRESRDNNLLSAFKSIYNLYDLNILESNTQRNIIQYIDSILLNNFNDSNYKILDNLMSILTRNDIIVDCIFGTGFSLNKSLKNNINYEKLKVSIHESNAIKIACDTPSGIPNILGHDGDIDNVLGNFDYTISMGAINLSLLDSRLKDKVGKIKVSHLGIINKLYQKIYNEDTYILLEKKDLKLPIRTKQNSNKGSYGNVFIIGGEMSGASMLSALAAQSFGAGKVNIYNKILTKQIDSKNDEIIFTDKLPNQNQNKYNSFAIGMGLMYDNNQYKQLFSLIKTICYLEKVDSKKDFIQPSFVFDADILYRKELCDILPFLQNVVLTPHPKEFHSILQNMQIISSKHSLEYVLRNISALGLELSKLYPHIVCLIKGANTNIVYNNTLYIHTKGHCNLAKGGSGDILSGMIASLLAQGISSFESCKNASLAHALASKKALKKWQNYALTPKRLISVISKL